MFSTFFQSFLINKALVFLQHLNHAELVNYLPQLLLIDLVLGYELYAVNVDRILVEFRNGFKIDLNIFVRKHTIISAYRLRLILFLKFC